MPRLVLVALLVLTAWVAGCGEDGPAPSGRGTTSGPLFGFADGGFRTPALAEPIAKLEADAGAQIVRVPVRWAEIQPEEGGAYDFTGLDAQLTSLLAHQVRPLLLVTAAPRWAQDAADKCPDEECPPGKAHLDDWGDFLQALVKHAAIKQPIGIEIWNEPNFRINWHTKDGPDARRYAALLAAAAKAVRKADPALPVVLGGLAPTADEPPRALGYADFLRDVYRHVPLSAFDGIGIHPYTSPDKDVPAPGLKRFRRVLDTVRRVREAAGDREDDTPLWITEVGFYTGMPARGDIPAHGGEVDEQEQAKGLLALHDAVVDAADVRAFLVFRIRDDAASPHEAGFGVVRSDGKPKPAYTALQQRFAAPTATP